MEMIAAWWKSFLKKSPAILAGAAIMFCTLYMTGYLWRGNEGCFVARSTAIGSRPAVDHFNFKNYLDDGEMKKFADEHFPVGTDRAYIEAILVGHGGARVGYIENNPAPKLTRVSYRYDFLGINSGIWPCSTGLSFIFNERNETVYEASSSQRYVVKYRPYSIVGGCDGL